MLIQIPVLPNGDFDIQKQIEIAKRYNTIKEIKDLMQEELKKIQEYSLII